MSYIRTIWGNGQTALSAEHLNNIEEGIGEAMQKAQGNSDMWSYIRNLVYPVGSIYMSATLSTKEAVEAALGGTWVAWGSGRVPVGVGTSDRAFAANEMGGASNAVLPQHSHSVNSKSFTASGNYSGTTSDDGVHSHVQRTVNLTTFKESGDTTEHYAPSGYGQGDTSYSGGHHHTYSGSVSVSGTLGSHNTNNSGVADVSTANLQPYITCYMWKRTA